MMQVNLSNMLEECPSDCQSFDLDNESFYTCRTQDGYGVINVIVSCKYIDVCKLRPADE